MPRKRMFIAISSAVVLAIAMAAALVARAATGGGNTHPTPCPPHDLSCIAVGVPTEYIRQLPPVKQTFAARILQDYHNAVTTPHPRRAVPLAFLTPEPATPTPLVAGSGVRPCHASDLTTGWLGSNGAGGMLIGYIGLGNASLTPCRLALPGVQLIDAAGHVILVLPGRPCTPTSAGTCIASPPLLMLPGLSDFHPHTAAPIHAGQAVLAIDWRPLDDAGSPCPAPLTATVIRFVLPEGGGNLDVSAAPEFPKGIIVCHSQAGIFGFGGAS